MADYDVTVTYRYRYQEWLDEDAVEIEVIPIIARSREIACFLAGTRVTASKVPEIHILDVEAVLQN